MFSSVEMTHCLITMFLPPMVGMMVILIKYTGGARFNSWVNIRSDGVTNNPDILRRMATALHYVSKSLAALAGNDFNPAEIVGHPSLFQLLPLKVVIPACHQC